MEITFIGHSCFKVKGKDTSIVIDPYDPEKLGYRLPKLEADVLLISHEHDDHNNRAGVGGVRFVIDKPGEYEISGVFINGLESFHDTKEGSERGKNIMFLISIDGYTVLHLGDLGHELSKETLELIPEINVLLIPVGGVYTIDAKTAAKVISSIEPAIVVPMHYQTKDLTGLSNKLGVLEDFLEEMGVEDAKRVEKLKITGKTDVPEETEVVVIAPQH